MSTKLQDEYQRGLEAGELAAVKMFYHELCRLHERLDELDKAIGFLVNCQYTPISSCLRGEDDAKPDPA